MFDTRNNLSHQVVQEIKDLNGCNPEAVYMDYNYWKPIIDYSLDDLISEIKK